MRKNLSQIKKNLFLLFLTLSASAAYAAEADSLYSFAWACSDQTKECTVHIGDSLLSYYRNQREHLAYRYASFNGNDADAPANFFSFMYSKHDRAVVRELARQLGDSTMTELERIKTALAFVQALPYAKDRASKGQEEYLRYPVETLADGMGDCEDKAVLLGAILGVWDVDFILLLPPDHLAVGVHCGLLEADRYFQFEGKTYYYMETTQPGWEIGKIPKELARAKYEVYPRQTTLTLIVKGVWFESSPASPMQQADCTLKLELFNTGPGDVTGLGLEVLLVRNVAGREEGVSELAFPLEDLLEGEVRMEEVRFKSLVPKNLVLRMRLAGETIDPQLLELKTSRRSH